MLDSAHSHVETRCSNRTPPEAHKTWCPSFKAGFRLTPLWLRVRNQSRRTSTPNLPFNPHIYMPTTSVTYMGLNRPATSTQHETFTITRKWEPCLFHVQGYTCLNSPYMPESPRCKPMAYCDSFPLFRRPPALNNSGTSTGSAVCDHLVVTVVRGRLLYPVPQHAPLSGHVSHVT